MVMVCKKDGITWAIGRVTSLMPFEVDDTACDLVAPVSSVPPPDTTVVPARNIGTRSPPLLGPRLAISDRVFHRTTLSLGSVKAMQDDGIPWVVWDGGMKL